MGTWDGENWIWHLAWRRDLFQWEEALLFELRIVLQSNCPRVNRLDSVIWKGSLDGTYSVKSFINVVQNQCFERTLPKEVTTFIWQHKAPPRAELVVWFLMHDKLKTGDRLLKLNIINENEALCPFCEMEIESVSHLFFTCTFSWRLWMSCFEWWGINSTLHADPLPNLLSWQQHVSGSFKIDIWNSLFFVIVWSIWFEWNQMCFKGKNVVLDQVLLEVKSWLA